MTKKDLISIIVPVHNGQDYLFNCIGSIVSQADSSYDMEIIIINDGSTDDTAIICDNLEKKHKAVHVISMDDLGVSCGRNAGLDIAQGDFITFVDADDRLLPGTLKHLYEICNGDDCSFAGIGFMAWSDENDYAILVMQKGEPSNTAIKSFTGNEYIDMGILSGDSRCWGKLYRTSHIKEIRFKEGMTIGEDMLFLLDVTLIASRIVISDYEGYGYYKNPLGAMLRPFKPEYMDQITCWKLVNEKIKEVRPDLMYRVTSNIMISIMLTVGKIAVLPKKERKKYRNEIRICRQEMSEAGKEQGAFGILSKDYKLKVMLFYIIPNLYIKLYHIWKRGGNQ